MCGAKAFPGEGTDFFPLAVFFCLYLFFHKSVDQFRIDAFSCELYPGCHAALFRSRSVQVVLCIPAVVDVSEGFCIFHCLFRDLHGIAVCLQFLQQLAPGPVAFQKQVQSAFSGAFDQKLSCDLFPYG